MLLVEALPQPLWPLCFGAGAFCRVEEPLSAPCLHPCVHSLALKVLEAAQKVPILRKGYLKPGLMPNISSSCPSFPGPTPFPSVPGRCRVLGVSFLLTSRVPHSLPFHVMLIVVLFDFPPLERVPGCAASRFSAAGLANHIILPAPGSRRASTLEGKILLLSRHHGLVKLPQNHSVELEGTLINDYGFSILGVSLSSGAVTKPHYLSRATLRAAVSFPHHVHRSERFWDSCRDDGRTQAPNGCVGWCVAGGC